MKRLFCAMLTLILFISFTAASTATEVARDVEELFQYWEVNGYPDDVGGVYFDAAAGGLVITLVGADEARKEEILSMIESTEGLRFGESKYAYNEMLAVQEEIMKDMSGNNGIYVVRVGWISNKDGVTTGFGESGKEFRIVVSVDKSVFDEYVTAYASKYGDMVYVEEGEAPVDMQGSITVDAIAPVDSANPAFTWLIPAGMITSLLAVILVLMLRRKSVVSAVQSTKETTMASEESEINPS